MLIGALLIVLIAAIGSDTPTARHTRQILSALGRKLPRTWTGRLVLIGVVVGGVWAVVSLLGNEMLGLAAPAMPELLLWFTLFDAGTLLDVLALAAIATLAVRFRTAVTAARILAAMAVRFGRRIVGHARRRTPRRSHNRPSTNADEERGWLGLAFV